MRQQAIVSPKAAGPRLFFSTKSLPVRFKTSSAHAAQFWLPMVVVGMRGFYGQSAYSANAFDRERPRDLKRQDSPQGLWNGPRGQ